MTRKRKTKKPVKMTKARTAKKMRQVRRKCISTAKELVRWMAHFACVRCGRAEPEVQTQGSHIFPEKRYRHIAADPRNILCLCPSCHKFAANSWHESPLEAAEWFFAAFPGRYEELKSTAHTMVEQTLPFWESKQDALKVWGAQKRLLSEIGTEVASRGVQ